MFFNASKIKPSKFKRIIYLTASTILGLLLAFNVHALIEINFLHWARKQGLTVTFYGNCALPPLLQILLWFTGGIAGYFLGRFWWRKVYIERVWAKRINPRTKLINK
jgi:hypothetical protein